MKLRKQIERTQSFLDQYARRVLVPCGVLTFAGVITVSFVPDRPGLVGIPPFVLLCLAAPAAAASIRLLYLGHLIQWRTRFGMSSFLLTSEANGDGEHRLRVAPSKATRLRCFGSAVIVAVFCFLALRQHSVFGGLFLLGAMSPFLVMCMYGLAGAWRVDVDKERGTLLLWNWLRRSEFPMDSIDQVLLYVEASTAEAEDQQWEMIEAGVDLEMTDELQDPRRGRIFVSINEGTETFHVPVATVSGRQQSATEIAETVGRLCECPVAPLNVGGSVKAKQPSPGDAHQGDKPADRTVNRYDVDSMSTEEILAAARSEARPAEETEALRPTPPGRKTKKRDLTTEEILAAAQSELPIQARDQWELRFLTGFRRRRAGMVMALAQWSFAMAVFAAANAMAGDLEVVEDSVSSMGNDAAVFMPTAMGAMLVLIGIFGARHGRGHRLSAKELAAATTLAATATVLATSGEQNKGMSAFDAARWVAWEAALLLSTYLPFATSRLFDSHEFCHSLYPLL